MVGEQEKIERSANDQAGLALQSRLVDEGCIECGLCRKHCLYLQKYGLPKEIAVRNSSSSPILETSFECSLCGLCTAVCPQKIDPAAMFFTMRQVAAVSDPPDYAKQKSLLSYERWGASPLLSWYGLPQGCDTVFFPGCALAGTRSGRVLQVYEHLQKSIPALGLVLDCCTKPSHDLARKDYFTGMFNNLRQALKDRGIRRVLVACPSCYRVWMDYGGDIRVQTIYEELARTPIVKTTSRPMTVTVHDSCPTRYDAAIHAAVRSLVSSMGYTLAEMKHHGRTTFCCGEGGAACYLVPRFGDNWTDLRAGEAEGRPVVTYCAGCTNFLGRQSQAVHLTDLFFEPDETLAGRVKVARSPLTWLHRLLLKRKLMHLVRAGVTGRRTREGEIVFKKN